jgi:hypothetical protein
VLHTLLDEAPAGMTAADVATACERDPNEPGDIEEIEMALQILYEDGLAEREADPQREADPKDGADIAHGTDGPREADAARELETAHPLGALSQPDSGRHREPPAHESQYRPTRAAIRARELSF